MATCAKTAVLLAFLGLAACRSSEGSDAAADAFVDAYYVEFDHARAKALSSGGATRRIEAEEKLVHEARAQMQVEGGKARVYYSAPAKRQVGEEMVHYTYRLDVRQFGTQHDHVVVVMLAKREGAWKVIQFHEGEEREPSGDPGARTSTRTSTTVGQP